MKKIASSIDALKDHYEVVVVGSGYGGGVAAARLARLGREVCVLERGREIVPGEYPNTPVDFLKEVQTDTPLGHLGAATALFDVRYNPDMNVVIGCGLGGTSLINAGICIAPDARVLRDELWPAALRTESWQEYFARAEQMLTPGCYPEEFPRAAKYSALQSAGQCLNHNVERAKIAVTFVDGENPAGVMQRACIGCGDCVTGCNYHAKNTVLMNYLPDAVRHGATIFTQVKVLRVERAGERWQLHCHAVQFDAVSIATRTFTIAADVVVLAAGSLGSSEILLRSAQHGLPLSTRVGQRFSGNGDMVGFAYNNDREINGIGRGAAALKDATPPGPCSNGVLRFTDAHDVNQEGVLEDGVLPSAFAAFLPALFAAGAKLTGVDTDAGITDKLHELARELRSNLMGSQHGAVHNTLFMVAAGHDAAAGTLYLDNDRLRLRWPNAGKQPQVERAHQRMRDITETLGGTYIKNPVWNALTCHSLITGHPLGGCCMADAAYAGVVNHRGQVFSGAQGDAVYATLLVMDGAVIPRSLGANPLLTITALAERNCELLAAQRGWQ
jgi:cholesterol oxidase